MLPIRHRESTLRATRRAMDQYLEKLADDDLRRVVRNLLATLLVIGLLLWACTLAVPPGPRVTVHYLGLLAAITGFVGLLRIRLPYECSWANVASLVLAWCLLQSWAKRDFYEDFYHNRNSILGEFHRRTTYERWSHRKTYQSSSWEDENAWGGEEGGFLGGEVGYETKHGRWENWYYPNDGYLLRSREIRWYWYGQEISEGEWELRNR